MIEPTVTVDELAEMVGCSSRTIREEMKRRDTRLMFYRIGRNYRILKSSIQPFIDSKIRGGGRR